MVQHLNPHSSAGLLILWLISSAFWMLKRSYLTSWTTTVNWLIKNSDRLLKIGWLVRKVRRSTWFYIWTKRLSPGIINSSNAYLWRPRIACRRLLSISSAHLWRSRIKTCLRLINALARAKSNTWRLSH